MGCHDHRDCLHDLQTALYTVGILVIFLVNFLLYSVWQTKLDSRQFLTARKIYRISYHIVSYWYYFLCWFAIRVTVAKRDNNIGYFIFS